MPEALSALERHSDGREMVLSVCNTYQIDVCDWLMAGFSGAICWLYAFYTENYTKAVEDV